MNKTWTFTPKFSINDTVYFRDGESVSKLTVKSIQPIVMADNWKPDEISLTIRYYITGFVSSVGKVVAEELLYATADEAFK
jgi:hypothetical protein